MDLAEQVGLAIRLAMGGQSVTVKALYRKTGIAQDTIRALRDGEGGTIGKAQVLFNALGVERLPSKVTQRLMAGGLG